MRPNNTFGPVVVLTNTVIGNESIWNYKPFSRPRPLFYGTKLFVNIFSLSSISVAATYCRQTRIQKGNSGRAPSFRTLPKV